MATTNSNLPTLITEDTLISVKAQFEQTTNSIPSLTKVEDDEFKAMIVLDSNKESFIRDGIIEMQNAKGKIPSLANLQLTTDSISEHDSLYELEDIFKEFFKKIYRNRVRKGDIAYREMLDFYAAVDRAVGKVDGADEIKKRLEIYFARQSAGGTKQKKNGKNGNGKDTPKS